MIFHQMKSGQGILHGDRKLSGENEMNALNPEWEGSLFLLSRF